MVERDKEGTRSVFDGGTSVLRTTEVFPFGKVRSLEPEYGFRTQISGAYSLHSLKVETKLHILLFS